MNKEIKTTQKTGYKQTPIGEIPKEWEVVMLEDVAEVRGGKRLPKGHGLLDSTTPYPYIRVVNFKNMGVDTKNLKYLSPETYEYIKRYTISSEDVYISIAGTIGLVGIISSKLDGANLTENAAKLCNLKNINKIFLAHVLDSRIVKPQINAFIGKATQPKLALFRIEKIKIPFPSFPEQRRIAKILFTVDEAIQRVDEAIAKTERLKRGLMQRLLTRGIGYKEFKFSKELVCEIPKEWSVVRLGDVCEINPRVDINNFSKDIEVSFVPMEAVAEEGRGIIKLETVKLKEVEKGYTHFRDNDVIFAKITPCLENGKVAIVRNLVNGIGFGSTEFHVLRTTSKLTPEWLFYLVIRSAFRNLAVSHFTGSVGHRRVQKDFFEKVQIPLSPLSEQRKIATILSTVGRKLELERKRKEKLERIKRGLMNDLLTGRKRAGVVRNE